MKFFKSALCGLAIALPALCADSGRRIALTINDQKALVTSTLNNDTVAVLASIPKDEFEMHSNMLDDSLDVQDRIQILADVADKGYIKYMWPVVEDELPIIKDAVDAFKGGKDVPEAFGAIRKDIENHYLATTGYSSIAARWNPFEVIVAAAGVVGAAAGVVGVGIAIAEAAD
ncbi:MAG: hypothetical protein M1820_005292 [Bogoriella megaspora]|nr:MAG: hypothetical protein M1820_005292 [Bogoriella megaspora]